MTMGRLSGSLAALLCALFCCLILPASPAFSDASDPQAAHRADFVKAWDAARRGDRATTEALLPGLGDYLLYPYLEYNAMLSKRSTVDPTQMAAFLDTYQDWAFTPGLERAWLRAQGERRNWDTILQYADGQSDTRIRCYRARARLARGQKDGLQSEAQSLWLAGQSQPKECDPLFDWLIAEGGVSSSLAWARIKLSFDERNPGMARYLKRFLDAPAEPWADRWIDQDRARYARLDQARSWPDNNWSQDITSYGLRRLARSDGDRAWRYFNTLDGHFSWSEAERASILREIAVWSAVEGTGGIFERMRAVPADYRDGTMLEWWARAGIAKADWVEVIGAVDQMDDSLRDDDRWQYWWARAAMEQGRADEGQAAMERVANRATYYGFLAADQLDSPYYICPETPNVEASAIDSLKARPDIARSLELRKAGIDNWARSEWTLATKRLDVPGLRAAAGLAIEEDWPDVVILALADSGDFNWYEWRFPVAHQQSIQQYAAAHNLDPSWVMGLMRSESAMAADAVSSAGARGLMQLMPGTAQRVSRRQGISYQGSHQLSQPDMNIQLGTAYLREMLDEYSDNRVLATGAYNAGPGAVDRWLDGSRPSEAAAWIETISYFETREYIPRVLAFSTIYDWRTAQPVVRVSSRMPAVGSGTMMSPKTAEVVCPGDANMGAE